jgi:uncharacterized membrane protein YciS (DUF1049 family)
MMNKVKLVLWIVIIGLFGLVIYQNQDFFLSRHSLGLNFYVAAYRTVELPNAVLFAAFFLIGWLVAYIFSLTERYRSSRTIKNLRQKITIQQSAIDALKSDVEALKTDNRPSSHVSEQNDGLPGDRSDSAIHNEG